MCVEALTMKVPDRRPSAEDLLREGLFCSKEQVWCHLNISFVDNIYCEVILHFLLVEEKVINAVHVRLFR